MVPAGRSTWDYVLARVAIDFRRELREDDDFIVASCRLARLGRSSIVTREEVRMLDGELSGRSRVGDGGARRRDTAVPPLTPAEIESFGGVTDS